jgi:hypothetical protein
VSAAAPANIVLRSICDLLFFCSAHAGGPVSPPFRGRIYPQAPEPVLRIKLTADL